MIPDNSSNTPAPGLGTGPAAGMGGGPGGGAGFPEGQRFTAPAADTTLSEALITLRKRRLLLILCVLMGAAVGFYKALTQIPVYEAFAEIEIRTGSSDQFKLTPGSIFGDDPQRKLLTEEAIITSDSLLAKVGRDLNLPNRPEFYGLKTPLTQHQSMEDAAVRQGVVGALQAGLHVTQVPKTDLLRISYTGRDQKLSAEMVNKVVADYRENSYESRYASSENVQHFLSGQLDELKNQVLTSQAQMLDLQKRLGVLGFDATHNQIATSLDDLAKAAAEARLSRILAESRFRLLNSLDPNTIEGASLDTVPGGQGLTALSTLRTSLANARSEYARLTAPGMEGKGPNHPDVIAAKSQMDELTKEVRDEENRQLTQARSAFELAKANETQTTAALEQQKADAYKLRDDPLKSES